MMFLLVEHYCVNRTRGASSMRWIVAVTLLITHAFLARAGEPDLAINESAVQPHLTYRTFLATDCEVVEGCNVAGTRVLLSFETEVRNIGDGDLNVGRPENNTNCVWAACHGHYHFEEFAHYRLLDSSGGEVLIGNKMAFCLEDTYRWRVEANSSRRYSCNTSQGLQAGWADVYDPAVPCQNLDITDLPGGDYILEITLDPQKLIPESDDNNNTVRVAVTLPENCVAPTNDAFASAQVLSGAAAVAVDDNACATKEPGEPDHAGVPGGHSVWYRWIAPANATAEINTEGSDFDTVLAVYTGTNINALTLIAENDDIVPFTNQQSSVTFSAVAGSLYHIAVDGWGGEVGRVIVQVNGPPNDAFGSCAPLSGLAGQITGSNIGATREQTEPAHAGNIGGRSVWYCWTALTNTVVTVDTVGSSIDTLLAVYTGTDLASLTEIASDDDSGSNQTSRLVFDATSGTTYHIAVDNFAGSAAGSFTLRWASGGPPPPPPVPPNDAFGSCAPLSGLAGQITGSSNIGATREQSEPAHAGNIGGRSVWYCWTAPTNTVVTLDTVGSSIDTLLAVYTGTHLASLNEIASDNDSGSNQTSRVVFDATSGTTYHIAVDNFAGTAPGNFTLRWASAGPPPPPPPPANDAFGSCSPLSGLAGQITGSNIDATREQAEPAHAGTIGGRSVWYCWTAPTNTVVIFDTVGSGIDTVLAVYTGTNLASLTEIASDDDSGSNQTSRLVFDATRGTTYHIAVDNFADSAPGNFTLRWASASPPPPPPPPPNDAFGSCAPLSGLAGQITGSNIGATREQTEPAHAGNIGGRSVWYCWTAPTNAVVTLDTVGSSIDTLLAVYTGTNLASLTEIASDNDSGSNQTSRLVFNATSGTTYRIAVDNFADSAPGNFTLRWVSASPPPPPSDIWLTVRRQTSGNIEVKLHAPRGVYFLQTSTNFSGWRTLSTMIMGDTPFGFTDTNRTDRTRFYRAMRQP